MAEERKLHDTVGVPNENKVRFHHIKGNLFRVIHADGAVGGITPTGEIFFSLFNQRMPIPKLIVQGFTETGELGPEIMGEREIRDGIIREVEVGVIMNPTVAKQLRDWLDQNLQLIAQVAAAQQSPDKERSE